MFGPQTPLGTKSFHGTQKIRKGNWHGCHTAGSSPIDQERPVTRNENLFPLPESHHPSTKETKRKSSLPQQSRTFVTENLKKEQKGVLDGFRSLPPLLRRRTRGIHRSSNSGSVRYSRRSPRDFDSPYSTDRELDFCRHGFRPTSRRIIHRPSSGTGTLLVS